MWNDADTSDTSAYLWDSPQPDHQPLPQTQESKRPPPQQQQNQSNSQNGNSVQGPGQYSAQAQAQASQQKHQADTSGKTPAMFSMPSSASESSDQSSTSNSSTQKKRKSSRSASPPDIFGDTSFLDTGAGAGPFVSDKLFEDSNSAMNAMYPGMGDGNYTGQDFGGLSLDSVASGNNHLMSFGNQNSPGYSNQTRATQDQSRPYRDTRFATLYSPQNRSPVGAKSTHGPHGQADSMQQMPTIQPSQTQTGFGINSSGGNSPMVFGSHESSPGAFANTGGSPFSANNDMIGGPFSNSPAPAAPSNLKHEESLDFGLETSQSQPHLPDFAVSFF